MSEIVEVCEKCRGPGIMATNPKDKADNPPIELCEACGGSGEPKKVKDE